MAPLYPHPRRQLTGTRPRVRLCPLAFVYWQDTVIDATFKGSLARFINHSCDPSCTTRIIAVEGSKKIVIYAERDIAMGEELFYDYKFPLEADESARVACRCGSEKCRGFIN